jgi:hypothetical protein
MKKIIIIYIFLTFSIVPLKSQPNSGFENWSTVFNYQSPDGWQTLNFLSVFSPPNPISSFKATGIDKHSGNFALKIKTIFVNNNPAPDAIDDTVGLVFTGKINLSPPSYKYGFPYVGRPEKLEFWAKYTPIGSDTGGAIIVMRKWNGTGNDTIAYGELKISATEAFTLFKVDLTYYSAGLPDSAAIIFGSSKRISEARVGSTIYVDDVALTGWVGIDEQTIYADKVKVFPNPAKEEISIIARVDDAYNVKVIDIMGKQIGIYKIENYVTTINCRSFLEGIYYYEIADKNDKILIVGKFNVLK